MGPDPNRQLPGFHEGSPFYLGLPTPGCKTEKPAPIFGAIWQPRCELIAGNSGADDDWNTCAVPLVANFGRDGGSVHEIPFFVMELLQLYMQSSRLKESCLSRLTDPRDFRDTGNSG